MRPGARHLNPLLDWVQRDDLPRGEVVRRLRMFIAAFQRRGARPRVSSYSTALARRLTSKELAITHAKLGKLVLLAESFQGERHPTKADITPEDVWFPLRAASLRFLVAPERGDWTPWVEAGRLSDLVPFLAYSLLVGPVRLARCPAPARGNWKKTCDRLFAQSGRGRPRRHCSDECTERRADMVKHQRRMEDV